MAAEDDLDDLEAQLEDYDDDDDDDLPPLKRIWKKHKLLILPLASLPIFGLVILMSTGDDTIGDRKVVVVPELAKQPGQPIKLQPEQEDAGGPAGKDKDVFNVVAEGENEGKIAIVAPPEEPKEPAPAAGESETGPIAMLPEGAEKTPEDGKDNAKAGMLPPPTPPESDGEVVKDLPAPGGDGKAAENILPAPDAPAKDDKPETKADDKPAAVAVAPEEPTKPAQETAKKDAPASKPAEDNQLTVVIPKKSEAEQETEVAAVVPKATATAAKVQPSAPRSDSGTTPMRTMAGVYRVQIASARSEGAAKTLWDKQVNKYPDVLGKLPLTVQQAVVKDRGTFYRVQGGAFNDRDTADSVCRKLKARGQDCIVVRP